MQQVHKTNPRLGPTSVIYKRQRPNKGHYENLRLF